MVLIMAYLLAVLFLGWLFAVLYRIWRYYWAARGSGKENISLAGRPEEVKRMAVLLNNEDKRAEWIVRSRVAAAIKQAPQTRVVLVDGDSTDQTPLILERLARQFNLGFCRLNNLGEQCARSGKPGSQNSFDSPADLHDCPAPCFAAARLEAGGNGNTGFARAIRCVVYAGEGSSLF